MQEELKLAHAEIASLKEKVSKALRNNPLTGLPNKVALHEYLELCIPNAKRQDNITAVFFTDLDNFKNINDQYSHEFGDECLQAAAKAYKDCLREADSLFHISGDEFIVVATLKDIHEAEIVKKKLQKSIDDTKVMYGDVQVNLGVSVGYDIVFSYDDANSTLTRADHNLQSDKKERKNLGLRQERDS
tara:strand:+ start:205893 stop:206456 length:564 start_codon:yes stop_codon:yes gene_type:complete